MDKSATTVTQDKIRATPKLHQNSKEIQKFGTRFPVPLGIDNKACEMSITDLNQILADTATITDLYRKCHWQTAGLTFYQLHLLYEKHYKEQAEIVDSIAERIQILGGVSVAMPRDVAELSQIENPPKGREEVPVQISRLVEAHEIILKTARAAAKRAADNGDDGTNDLFVSEIIRTNEMQTWFLSEHLVALNPVKVEGDISQRQ